MNEFELIDYFFAKKSSKKSNQVLIGIGDDAAVLNIPKNKSLAVSIDTLVAGVHFPHSTKPFDIGYKSLAVNLSDLAAMGSKPAWITLALTLPSLNKKWLSDFSKGFFTLIKKYDLQLVGGDITRGPLSITIEAHGTVSARSVLRRDQAKIGDRIYVTGTLGDAGLALKLLGKKSLSLRSTISSITAESRKKLLKKLNQPEPRIAAGLALNGLSRCAIDLSDGLLADLNHILKASNVGASIEVNALPLSKVIKKILPLHTAWEFALHSGDDYELCFTVPPRKEQQLMKIFKQLNCPITCIGKVEKQKGLRVKDPNGKILPRKPDGYRHF